ncbi:MAG: hypothetical protein KDD85_13395 [Parvularculaceae bacterium]|nr:hypothetical protein [Parvularculaceae bacterium]
MRAALGRAVRNLNGRLITVRFDTRRVAFIFKEFYLADAGGYEYRATDGARIRFESSASAAWISGDAAKTYAMTR